MSRIERFKERQKMEKKKLRKKRRKKMIWFFVTLIVLFTLYSFLIEPKILLVKEVKLETNKIGEEMHGLKVVQFSDLHYGTYYNKNNINKLVKKINSLNPDIIIFSGDLVESTYALSKDDINVITKSFSKLNAKIGKYSIYGNHDYDVSSFDNIMYDSNFNILKNNYDLVYNNDNNPIMIYGIDDMLEGNPDTSNINEVLDIYKIVVVHEPDYIDNLDTDKIDLVLAGHSHNKQINIPYISNFVLPEGSKKYYKDHYKVNNTDLYISNGVGCGLIPARFLSIPSINFFRITNSK